MSGLFCFTDLLKVGRRKTILKTIMDFNSLKANMKYNPPIINVKTKMFLLKRCWNTKIPKSKENIELKFAI